jgi:hypothetical protein
MALPRQPQPPPKKKKPTGRPFKGPFTPDEQSELLNLIRSGFGLAVALQTMHSGWSRYRRSLAQDEEFREAVQLAIRYKRDCYMFRLHEIAVSGDPEETIDAHGQKKIVGYPLDARLKALMFLITLAERARVLKVNAQLKRLDIAAKTRVAESIQKIEPLDPALASRILEVISENTTDSPDFVFHRNGNRNGNGHVGNHDGDSL